VDKRSFGDLEDDEDDIFGSKKVLFSFYDLNGTGKEPSLNGI
jgi:hypothetical protein